MYFDKRVILFDQVFPNQISVLKTLTRFLEEKNCVKSSYQQAIINRESQFPTGLNTTTVGVAIQHTDGKYVNETQIAFMSLSKPVEFKQMGDNAKVEAKFIFMLALDNPHKQPQMLQRLMALFQNEKAMKKLETIKDEKDFIEIMKKEGIEEGQ